MKTIEIKNCRECRFLEVDEDGLWPECYITGKNLKNNWSNSKHKFYRNYNNAIPKWCPLLKETYQIIVAKDVNIYKEEK